MTIKIDEQQLVVLLGENGEHWLQGGWGDDTSMCLHGAIRRCAPVKGDAQIIEQVAARLGWGTDWNDDEATDWSMVRDRLANVEVSDVDLELTFGPQWAAVVALVRRAAILTVDEVHRLAAARDAAWGAARGAARAAAWDAAWGAAWVAARDAAWDAARAAAWAAAGGAAWGAARALVVRDLIGGHGFTQAHYDLLTGQWATVIGPVHPDDEARRG